SPDIFFLLINLSTIKVKNPFIEQQLSIVNKLLPSIYKFFDYIAKPIHLNISCVSNIAYPI
ncbi:MAG: hypothetical protein AABX78_00445, partial [Nanoarchaeota archaeon]